MMLRYSRVFLLLAIVNDLSIYAQPADPLNVSIIPPAPTAAALAKYALTPVNLSSGIPTVEIPLYEIADHDVKLPVSLSYHGGGIKIGQIASWTGLGWSLNAGGVVTRTVMGLPDEKPSAGFMYFAGSILSAVSVPPTEFINHQLLVEKNKTPTICMVRVSNLEVRK